MSFVCRTIEGAQLVGGYYGRLEKTKMRNLFEFRNNDWVFIIS